MVPAFVWRCQQVSPERAAGAQADANLTPTIAATSVGTGATMPMTATASARGEVVAAGKGIQPILHVIMADMILCFIMPVSCLSFVAQTQKAFAILCY